MKQSLFHIFAVIVLSISSSAFAAEKPNILFIFADDQCYDTIHALGNDEIRTPNLDRLVSEGTTFTQCYNMGGWNGAICVASRTMINTGRYIWHANKVNADLKAEVENGRFWAEHMKSAGYRTYMTGKWHVKYDAAKTFDIADHIRGGMPKQTEAGYSRPVEGQPDKWSPYDKKFGGFWEGGKHWSTVVADDALSFFEDAKAQDSPFFMYIAFNAPHDPRQSPKKYVDMYPEDKIKVPTSFQPLYPYHNEIGLGKNQRDEKLAPFPRTEYSVRVNRQEYYAIITHMDHQIGRILDGLEKSGKRNNTWIFFTADHGLAVGHHGMIGKQNMYDHSIRVPFMVVGPGVPKGKKIDTSIYLQDVMPTTLELADLKKPKHVDFHSLLPILSGERNKTYYPAIYGGYIDLQRMVKQDGYKLILYPRISKARLYHVAEDPNELDDLFDNPDTQATSLKLFQSLLELQKENGDTLDLKAAFPHLAAG
ncbi:sulfatase-like hydrolase/transferase [Thalassoglobus polymorphus]|uniref:Arylsulfatase n=1 Tax=Thalassoglobus polymorphus TaxID=2527994 RepID=A0A517QLF0_9PLAN|nr:sulfatase-like hydrolase/transferase [Thalassoglobus polymorphus]QDT32456.1 Arylsulfatase [Thalassoglobus polymorphus]